MRERKYVKMRVDMYEDTKLKMIDQKPERDLINYVWNRLVLLAGKVNLEGALYFSKTRPYNIETLAIEFNRSASEIKLALDVLIELEMIDFKDAKFYSVTNFVKHQNIKTKEKVQVKDTTDAKEISVETKIAENPIIEKVAEEAENEPASNLEDTKNAGDVEPSKVDNSIPIPFKVTINKKTRRKNKKDALLEADDLCTEELPDDYDGTINGVLSLEQQRRLAEEQVVVSNWRF
jgi:predicted phage replisome organizer